MTYNIHPIFVHFPIAFLVLYSVIKILPFQKWIPSVSWKQVERVLLFFGLLGAMASLWTGETAEHLTRASRDIVEAHALFATTATWMYGALLFGEALVVAIAWLAAHAPSVRVPQVVVFFRDLLTHPILASTLAILGLVTLTITGLLGGVMVYGTSADPFAAGMLRLLGIEY